MSTSIRRVVTGHDAGGRSILLSDGAPPQNHPMRGPQIGADFHEIWSDSGAVPGLTSAVIREPNERPFTLMPPSGHLIRILEVYPLSDGGKRTAMQRPRIRSLAFSATITTGAFVLPPTILGKIEASTTRSASMPRTCSSGFTTAIASMPMRQLPTGWCTVAVASRR